MEAIRNHYSILPTQRWKRQPASGRGEEQRHALRRAAALWRELPCYVAYQPLAVGGAKNGEVWVVGRNGFILRYQP